MEINKEKETLERKLLEKILDKKELKSLDREFGYKILKQIISQNKNEYKKLEKKEFNEKSKEYDLIIKLTRKKLRDYFGSYNSAIGENKKEKMGEDLVKKHLSTRERFEHIEEVIDFIGETKSIIDLGCGYNPYFYKKFKGNPKYLASDISLDLKYIQEYFDKEKINGTTLKLDLIDENDLKKLEEISINYETILMLKLLDPLEKQKKNITRKIFSAIKSNQIIVSFSTMSIGGKVPIKSKRSWFYKIVKEKKLEEKIIGTEKYIKIQNRS